MRFKLGQAISLVCFLLITGCGNEDLSGENEYTESNPKISNVTLAFVQTEERFEHDTIKLSFDIQDAEWDIGLDYTQIDSPYHFTWFFVLNGSSLTRFIPRWELNDYGYELIANTNQPGKIATYRRLHNLDTTLEYSCANFFNAQIVVNPNLVDEHDFIEDTVRGYYVIYDSIYMEPNENHLNLLVDFLEEQDDGSYAEFDWVTEYCTNFNARIPDISTLPVGPSVRSGTLTFQRISKTKGRITYDLSSPGFQYLFGGKKIKLRFYIKDRALQNSNVLETEPLLIPA